MRIAVAAAIAFSLALAAPALGQQRAATPVRVLLVGDSTVAKGSGWGDAFCAGADAATTCRNMAKGGRSSKSYRAEGSWDQVLAELKKTGPWRSTYVLIQFGHNDQPGKADRSSDFATAFSANMARYVAEVRGAGAQPVLVTPLTRRQFRDGLLIDGLSAWSASVRKVARQTKTPLLDLGGDSVVAVQVMGPAAAMDLAQAPPPPDLVEAAAKTGTTLEAPKPAPGAPAGQVYFDYTHLGPKGAALFSQMIEEELAESVPPLAAHFKP